MASLPPSPSLSLFVCAIERKKRVLSSAGLVDVGSASADGSMAKLRGFGALSLSPPH